jgi:hypothetical protein
MTIHATQAALLVAEVIAHQGITCLPGLVDRLVDQKMPLHGHQYGHPSLEDQQLGQMSGK